MAEERRNELLDSPLYDFVKKGWVKWSQVLVSVQAGEEDFLLYLVWALDTIKASDEDTDFGLWDDTYAKLRRHFISKQYASNKGDLDYLTDLVCAAALACYGLGLMGSMENQRTYNGLVKGMGEHWGSIRNLKCGTAMDASDPGLKEWVVSYLADDRYYTYSDIIEWDNGKMAEQLIRRSECFEKIDLLRIIMALYECGAFEAVGGGKPTKKKVFQAFGEMLGENLDDFNNNLSAGSVTYADSIDIFDRLKNGFEKYEQSKDAKLKKQGKSTRRP